MQDKQQRRIKKLASFVKQPNLTVFSEIEQIGSNIEKNNELLEVIAEEVKKKVEPINIPEFTKVPEPKEVVFPEVQKVAGKVQVENISDIKLDLRPIIEALKAQKYPPSTDVDYTLILSDIANAVEKVNPDIPKIVELLGKLPTSEEIKELKDIFKNHKFSFDKSGRLEVNVDRVGGGGGGLYSYLRRVSDNTVINPATEDKQDDIITALAGTLYTVIRNTLGSPINPAIQENQLILNSAFDDANKLKKYKLINLDSTTSATIRYAGTTKADKSYLIYRYDFSGVVPDIKFASIYNNPAISTYAAAWPQRTLLTYNYLDDLLNV